ncbi:MAG: hypothetical protein LWY06_13820 [Firmicutes bacterium]|nr:hypothetical protein [Bacillota bacterium]
MKKTILKLTSTILILFAVVLLFTPSAFAKQKTPPVLGKVKTEINSLLAGMDKDLAETAKIIGKAGLTSKESRKAMQEIQSKYQFVIDCCTVDTKGKIVAAEPDFFKSSEGKDISSQEQVQFMLKNHKPVISRLFFAVEGMDALDFERPVFDSNGKFIGAVSLLIDSEKLFGGIIDPATAGVPVDIWAVQTNGTVVFDPDREEIGRSIISDPIYKNHKGLVEAAKKMLITPEGHGYFDFQALGKDKPAQIEATWTTITFHGTKWRLVVTQTRNGDAKLGIRTLSSLGLVKTDEALRKLAANPDFVAAVAADDRVKMMKYLSDFFKANKGLYAVEWANNRQINVFGYPEDNSLRNYDFKNNAISSQKTLKALQTKGEASYEEPLIEGKTGNYFMVPVFKGDEYLGSVYYIILEIPHKSK